MDLNRFMNQGIAQLVKSAGRYYLNNPKGIAFLAKIAPEIKKSAKRRQRNEETGLHVPPLIIASIASRCNLHCAGCYSRATGACSEHTEEEMTAAQWEKILREASGLGVTFVLLAGGEPLMRKDVMEVAASFRNMVFPVFTNATMMDQEYFALFEQNRNFIPVFSIEGGKEMTDRRRGEGAYEAVHDVMRHFKKKKMLFGASVTVTKENMDSVVNDDYVQSLRNDGCGVLFFVEYVPIEAGTEHLMLDKFDIEHMQEKVERFKQGFDDMIFVSFPGDEEMMGGCLASGRGFFHINANGGAEPCPFSPYSKLNLKTDSIETVLRSGFFGELRKIAADAEHHGGCTLFDHEREVAALLNGERDF